MHICFVTIGDIKELATTKRALGLANVLHELGWEVSIIIQDANENRIRVNLECNKYIKILYFKKSNFLGELLQKNELIKIANPSVIYYTSFSIRNMVGFFHTSIKLVEHSELTSKIADASKIRQLQALLIENISVYFADALICASKYLVNVFEERKKILFATKTKIFYSPYAYNSSLLKNFASESISNTPVLTLLFIGSLVKNYGLMTLLHAMKNVVKHTDKIKLILVGKGANEVEARKFIHDNQLEDFIIMKGYIAEDELDNLFAGADIFLAPLNDSIQDWARCPSKLFMYLPYNKPVFTCRIGEALEIFGENGFYFDNNNPESLANLILNYNKTNIYTLPNPKHHTWDYRGKLLSNWVLENFKS